MIIGACGRLPSASGLPVDDWVKLDYGQHDLAYADALRSAIQDDTWL